MPDTEPTIIKVEMSDEMRDDAIKITMESLRRNQDETEILKYIKQQFDLKYKPSWHCVMGKNFCSYFTYEENCYIYFSISGRDYLLFKTPSQEQPK
ncbi:putative dynein light chain [Fasciola gigantica]|uniref:Dynein light chain n=1 Tax=Fasciola gigantica TaxID=46835 RepID=A0A504X0J9_FASGI|nr:putative dynein light chain [Fasciola gigantica]